MYRKLLELQAEVKKLQAQLQTISAGADEKTQKIIDNAKAKAASIDAEMQTIRIYNTEARRYVRDAQGQEPARQVQIAELQQLYTMLSNTAQGRNCASTLLRKSNAAMTWLQQRKDEVIRMRDRELAQLNADASSGADVVSVRKRLSNIEQSFLDLIDSKEMKSLLDEAKSRASRFFIQRREKYKLDIPRQTVENFCFGMGWFSFPIASKYADRLKQRLGSYFDPATSSILLPISFPAEKIGENGDYAECMLKITYNDRTEQASYDIVRGFLFNILRSYLPLTGRVLYIDLNTWNAEYLGFMKQFSGENALISTPADEKAALQLLSKMESDAYAEEENDRSRRFIIVRGSLGSSGSLENQLRKVANNTKKNNIVFLFLQKQSKESSFGSSAAQTIPITLLAEAEGDRFYTTKFRSKIRFGFHASPAGVSEDTVKRFRSAYAPKLISNRYEDAFDLSAPITYTRARRDILLTYGVDSRGNKKSIKFERHNFAAFLMGAAGFGKSTAIHAMVTNLICNYHPDEVELWLADFKLETFSFYTNPYPPHIRCILLDDSKELVFDFLDRLHDELLRREGILSSMHCDDRKYLPVSVYMPAIFVIIDEFTVMANVVKDDPHYKNLLQDLLVKGSSNGFCFLFSSQKFTTGASALTMTAKDQIGLRLSMGSPDLTEIKETLAIPSDHYTDEMTYAVSHLVKYHILQRERKPDGTFYLDNIVPFYFPGKSDNEAWLSRYALFRKLNKTMKKISVEQYTGKEINTYVDKHPSFVVRDSYEVFNKDDFLLRKKRFARSVPGGLDQGDFLLRLGVPRLIESDSMAIMTASASENLFLMSTDQELPCALSVILSSLRSASLQGVKVEVWTDSRNRLRRTYGQILSRLPCRDGADQVRSAVFDAVDSIRSGDRKPRLYVLLGLHSLLDELAESRKDDDFFQPVQRSGSGFFSPALNVKNDAEAAYAQQFEALRKKLRDIQDKVEEEGEAKGWSDEQIEEETDRRIAAYKKSIGYQSPNRAAPSAQSAVASDPDRNAKDELLHLLGGGKYGCHFLLYVNNYRDVNSFKHRVCFRTDTSETSLNVLDTSAAYRLPDHTAYYRSFGSSADSYPFVPYLHPGVCWDNWSISKDGKAVRSHTP